jgi:ferredoxin-NADP reductase
VTDLAAPSGGWRYATVRAVDHPTVRGVRLRLDVPDRIDHLPGQHYVVRLTAPDGYTAQRSYSLASAPSDPQIELFVERLPDGEVSGYLADVVEPGDELEVRGPIGGWFVWTGDAPAVGVAGGSGVVPLVAMMRHAAYLGRPELIRVAVSSGTELDLPYADELYAAGASVVISREASRTGRAAGRIAAGDLIGLVDASAAYYVCGSAGFAEAASMMLLDLDVPAERIRVERFGPTS